LTFSATSAAFLRGLSGEKLCVRKVKAITAKNAEIFAEVAEKIR
jgi:hypothetical protein